MNKSSDWQTRFDFKTCDAAKAAKAIPASAPGVAVVYKKIGDDETVYLVLESRAGSLRDFCLRRLQTPKLPPASELTLSYKVMEASDATPEAISAMCREQVILAGELRRELRPAMR